MDISWLQNMDMNTLYALLNTEVKELNQLILQVCRALDEHDIKADGEIIDQLFTLIKKIQMANLLGLGNVLKNKVD